MKLQIQLLIAKLQSIIKNIFNSRFGFIFLGISSTIWFLIRVISKPQRATYPCMQAAAPIMSSMVIYLLSIFGSISAYQQTKKNFRRRRYFVAGMFLLITVVSSILFFTQNNTSVFAIENIVLANEPVGTGRGIFPGRVVWIFDPKVAKFDRKTGNWWDEANTLQTETDIMLKESLLGLTAKDNEILAWEALFVHFNQTKKNQSIGYTIGQKIAIKINQNNTNSQISSKNINASPQMVLSLLKSLINEAGVEQKCITVFDASRFITDNIYNKCHAEFPEVVFVDNIGGNGRVKSTYKDNAIPFSANNAALAKGIVWCAVEADYLINMAILKGHSGQGITLCGKNWYGATSIYSDYTKNAHNNFSADATGKDRYMTFVDYMGHKDLGEKTILFIIDGIYASKGVSGVPSLKWQMKPFNNRWPSSIFVSQDQVAIDAVGLDFLRTEWTDMPDINNSEKYLIEAAQADNPPSKTFYDPEKDNVKCKSLGTFERWNNAENKQYSRNLGKNTGIELIFNDLTNTSSLHNNINNKLFEITSLGSKGNYCLKMYENKEYTIRINDMLGKCLVNKKTTKSIECIDLSIYDNGIYMLTIVVNKKLYSHKLFKK